MGVRVGIPYQRCRKRQSSAITEAVDVGLPQESSDPIVVGHPVLHPTTGASELEGAESQ